MNKLLMGKDGDPGQSLKEKNFHNGFFNITKFSQQLLDSLKNLENWPDKVKLMQKNWIGKSLGCGN